MDENKFKKSLSFTNGSMANDKFALPPSSPLKCLATSSTFLFFKVGHVGSCHGAPKELKATQSRDISSRIFCDIQGNTPNTLKFDISNHIVQSSSKIRIQEIYLVRILKREETKRLESITHLSKIGGAPSFKSASVRVISCVGSISSASSNPTFSRLTYSFTIVGLNSGFIPRLYSVNLIEWTCFGFKKYIQKKIRKLYRATEKNESDKVWAHLAKFIERDMNNNLLVRVTFTSQSCVANEKVGHGKRSRGISRVTFGLV